MPALGFIRVREGYCKGCELCINACPKEAIALASERLNVKGYHPAEPVSDLCTGCGICALVCPEAAIIVHRRARAVRS